MLRKDIEELAAVMKPGDFFTIPGRGGWTMEVTKVEGGCDFLHRQLTEDGAQSKFFEYSTRGNPYGAGKIKQEPTLGVFWGNDFGTPTGGKGGYIVGALIIDKEGRTKERFIWSDLVFIQKGTFAIQNNELFVNGVSKGFLQLMVLPDKNRLEGYVGIFGPEKAKEVEVWEMEEMVTEKMRTRTALLEILRITEEGARRAERQRPE